MTEEDKAVGDVKLMIYKVYLLAFGSKFNFRLYNTNSNNTTVMRITLLF
jgi:hypothetical protein